MKDRGRSFELHWSARNRERGGCGVHRKLREELEAFRSAAAEAKLAETRREENKKKREVEAVEEKAGPLEAYLEMLAAATGEDAWKDGLLGMGSGPDIPKLFRLSGKVRWRFPAGSPSGAPCSGPVSELQTHSCLSLL